MDNLLFLFIRDCWYLYTLNPLDRYITGCVDMEPDQTIEIMMTELDPEIMKTFTKNVVKDGKMATKVIEIFRGFLPQEKKYSFSFLLPAFWH